MTAQAGNGAASFRVQRIDGSNLDAHPAVVEAFEAQTVLITGAAGSVGSELARQVAVLPIARLLLLDRDENSMFELMRAFSGHRSIPLTTSILGDIRDEAFVRHIFAEWRPKIVLHAAAYKHVPIMEANPCEAVLNNVTGTRILADAAAQSGCERFLLISTDKAVEPSSIMGATKRIAELLMGERAAEGSPLGQKIFASVRFVNVIGSRGSVVPIFREQIAGGGPVTVTDPKMTRYFITVDQAACLLLQAATLSDSGSIYALEPGEPVKIMDLASKMIEAAGLVPGKDIAIEITGIRDGERLHERLYAETEALRPTAFPGIDRVHAEGRPSLQSGLVAELESAARRRDVPHVTKLLHELLISYSGPAKARASVGHEVADSVQFGER